MAVINSYEAVIVISLKRGEEAVAETVKKFTSLIEKHAAMESVDEWGKRRRLLCALQLQIRGSVPGRA